MKKAAAMNMKTRAIWIIMWAVVIAVMLRVMNVNIMSGKKEKNQAKNSREFSDTKWIKKKTKKDNVKKLKKKLCKCLGLCKKEQILVYCYY